IEADEVTAAHGRWITCMDNRSFRRKHLDRRKTAVVIGRIRREQALERIICERAGEVQHRVNALRYLRRRARVVDNDAVAFDGDFDLDVQRLIEAVEYDAVAILT